MGDVAQAAVDVITQDIRSELAKEELVKEEPVAVFTPLTFH